MAFFTLAFQQNAFQRTIMVDAFQPCAFVNNAFQIVTQCATIEAFQPCTFQNNAFQIITECGQKISHGVGGGIPLQLNWKKIATKQKISGLVYNTVENNIFISGLIFNNIYIQTKFISYIYTTINIQNKIHGLAFHNITNEKFIGGLVFNKCEDKNKFVGNIIDRKTLFLIMELLDD